MILVDPRVPRPAKLRSVETSPRASAAPARPADEGAPRARGRHVPSFVTSPRTSITRPRAAGAATGYIRAAPVESASVCRPPRGGQSTRSTARMLDAPSRVLSSRRCPSAKTSRLCRLPGLRRSAPLRSASSSIHLAPEFTRSERVMPGLIMRLPHRDAASCLARCWTRLGLAESSLEPARELSGGEQHGSALARSLLPRRASAARLA